jgi:cation:H+ antiporter
MVFIYYLIYTIRKGVYEDEKPKLKIISSIIFSVLGIVLIIIGSDLVVDNATTIATMLGISEKFVALTIVALGTSLPELVTSVVASIKKEQDIAIGNIVGSNIFNIGCVLGMSLGIFGNIENISFNSIDLVMLLLSSILLFITAARDGRITKKEGAFYLVLYGLYMVYLLLFSM